MSEKDKNELLHEVAVVLDALCRGRIPAKLDSSAYEGETDREVAERVNRLIDFIAEAYSYVLPLSRGELDIRMPRTKNFLASPFKELHSRLLHLTWQAQQVSGGNYSQRVDFMGDFSEAFNAMVIALSHKEKVLTQKIAELESVLCQVRTLQGMIPVCTCCKQPRTDKEYWRQVHDYVGEHPGSGLHHSFCPNCRRRISVDSEEKEAGDQE